MPRFDLYFAKFRKRRIVNISFAQKLWKLQIFIFCASFWNVCHNQNMRTREKSFKCHTFYCHERIRLLNNGGIWKNPFWRWKFMFRLWCFVYIWLSLQVVPNQSSATQYGAARVPQLIKLQWTLSIFLHLGSHQMLIHPTWVPYTTKVKNTDLNSALHKKCHLVISEQGIGDF